MDKSAIKNYAVWQQSLIVSMRTIVRLLRYPDLERGQYTGCLIRERKMDSSA